MKTSGGTWSAARILRRATSLGIVLAAAAVLAGGTSWARTTAVIYVVRNTDDSGPFSLRDAIDKANANVGKDTISFQIPGTGVQTIPVSSGPLPAITDPVVLDGRRQFGFSGSPLIRIDNGTGNATIAGLDVTAGSTQVKGLDITGFGTGIMLETAGGNTVVGNWIGIDPSGNVAANSTGVLVQGDSASNVIGGGGAKARNVISGNTAYGVSIGGGANVTRNVVSGNYIGTDVAGTAARPNGIGVFVSNAVSNTIGGTLAGQRNVISGNTTDGVVLEGAGTTNNSVSGNYIGLNALGAAALANGRYGIRASGGASFNNLGRSAGHNVISGNGSAGIAIFDATTTRNRVLGNRIGTNPDGTAALPNGGDGVSISGGATENTVGGSVVNVRNVISGNALSGVAIAGAASNGVVGNYIGTDVNGTTAVPNGQDGVTISASATQNKVGVPAVGPMAPVGVGAVSGTANLISGNAGNGVLITGVAPASGDTSLNFVGNNYIGTDVNGTAALPNGQDGVQIESTADNAVGNASAANVISGNKQMGVDIRGATSTGNTVRGNVIGPQAGGDAPLGNTRYGVVIQGGAHGNTVGGSLGGAPNVISSNKASGVIVRGTGTASNVVAGNLIGTNSGGAAALPNVAHGVEVVNGASGTTIGGSNVDLRNVISGNDGSGIRAAGSTGTIVQGNYIGTDAGGSGALGNAVNGVLLDGSSSNTVGGPSGARGNKIAFNTATGVKVDATGAPAAGNQIIGNSIDLNGSKGISLVGGANDGQVAPTIIQVKSDGVHTTVKATLASVPLTSFRIELFSSPACDPSGSGEGATFLATKTITTDASGNAQFSLLVAQQPAGLALTETATRQDLLDTSEFSTCATAP